VLARICREKRRLRYFSEIYLTFLSIIGRQCFSRRIRVSVIEGETGYIIKVPNGLRMD